MSRVVTSDSPMVGTGCPACDKVFAVGDRVVLVAIGPGDDPDAQAAAKAGRPYNAVAVPVHASCAGVAP